jgi:very-short-patch-repair endonuclease
MRRAMTEPERLLWRAIREKLPARGSHFRRQVCIGPYIADSCTFGARLVVEVDGEQHGLWTAHAERDRFLKSQGFKVLRFPNRDVRQVNGVVIDTIGSALNEPLVCNPCVSPTPGHSPEGGGEDDGAS